MIKQSKVLFSIGFSVPALLGRQVAPARIKTVQSALALALVTIPSLITYTQAGTLGGATSPTGSWGWSWSYENTTFTRANITLDDGTIVAAPTFDITEPDTFVEITPCYVDEANLVLCPSNVKKFTGMGSALFKGILKVTHGPAPEIGEALAELQMKWPEVLITIYQEKVEDSNTNKVFLKESRKYEAFLDGSAGDPQINTDKLTDGFKRIVPGSGTGVYEDCNTVPVDPNAGYSYLCYQEIGYGTAAIDPFAIFDPITTASGHTMKENVGFYWDEACLAFPPGDLGISLDGEDFNLSEDDDGYFRTCEGRSVAFNTCTYYPSKDTDNSGFNCNDKNPDGKYFTFILADAAAGDRLEPAPATTCIGSDVKDWLALTAYAGSGEDLVITPCDPNQGFMQLPYEFSDDHIYFTTSEGDATQIDNLQIVSIATRDEFATTLVLQESPDKTDSVWDFSNLQLKNISSIQSLELNDTVTGSAGTDVLLGGNGTDRLFGYSGDDCIDGQKNDDQLWGDSHALNVDADSGNDREVAAGEDIFVLTSQMGKDAIMDFSGEVVGGVYTGDKIVNVSGTPATVTANGDGTYTVALKGQNYVTVYVLNGGLVKGVNVLDASNLSNFSQCQGHPLY